MRAFARTPLLTVTAIVTLGIGAGANATVASFIDALLFRTPAEVVDPAQLVSIYTSDFSSGPYGSTSTPDYLSMVNETTAFSGIAAFEDRGVIVTAGSSVERVIRSNVSANFFAVLGIRPAEGRFFVTEDALPGAQPAAVIGHALWQRLFEGSASTLGATVSFNDVTYVVVGIAPLGFEGLDISAPKEIFTVAVPASDTPSERGNRGLGVVARLKPGVAREQAQRQLDGLALRLAGEYPSTNLGTLDQPDRPRPFTVTPYARIGARFRSQATAASGLLISVSLLVLVIAAANVGNLLMARAMTRQRELAIRIAIGASRRQVVRQLAVESVILGIAGAMAGIIFAVWTADALPSFFPAEQVRLLTARIDLRVMTFCLAVSVVGAVVFGLAPALQVLKPAAAGVLRRESTTFSEGRDGGRMRRAFVIVQVGFAFVLMIGAALLGQSLRNSFAADLGFGTRRGAVVSVEVPPDYSRERGLQYYADAVQRVEALPGVERTALTTVAPLSRAPRRRFEVPGYVPRTGEDVEQFFNVISPGYFEAMRIPLTDGRSFEDGDDARSRRVVIVNREFVRRYLPDGAIGRQIRDSPASDLTIVGVVDANAALDQHSPRAPVVFYPLAQSFARTARVIASTSTDPVNVLPGMVTALKSVDSGVAVFRPTTIEAHVNEALAADRLVTSLMSTCGLLALVLATVGLYGMVAYSVASRMREIGIRIALGASGQRVSRLVVNEVLVLVGGGIAFGVVFAAALSTVARSFLFGVSPLDPGTYVAVPAVMMAVGCAATVIPIKRALRIDPAYVLRQP